MYTPSGRASSLKNKQSRKQRAICAEVAEMTPEKSLERRDKHPGKVSGQSVSGAEDANEKSTRMRVSDSVVFEKPFVEETRRTGILTEQMFYTGNLYSVILRLRGVRSDAFGGSVALGFGPPW